MTFVDNPHHSNQDGMLLWFKKADTS